MQLYFLSSKNHSIEKYKSSFKKKLKKNSASHAK